MIFLDDGIRGRLMAAFGIGVKLHVGAGGLEALHYFHSLIERYVAILLPVVDEYRYAAEDLQHFLF
jgi:hypothetical protein